MPLIGQTHKDVSDAEQKRLQRPGKGRLIRVVTPRKGTVIRKRTPQSAAEKDQNMMDRWSTAGGMATQISTGETPPKQTVPRESSAQTRGKAPGTKTQIREVPYEDSEMRSGAAGSQYRGQRRRVPATRTKSYRTWQVARKAADRDQDMRKSPQEQTDRNERSEQNRRFLERQERSRMPMEAERGNYPRKGGGGRDRKSRADMLLY